MKVKLPLALVVVLAIALGYLMGTESGRQRRDVILVKVGRGREDASDPTPESEADDAPSG
jgi:hypothetical protein